MIDTIDRERDLDHACSVHDWHHEFSDDPAVYRRGVSQWVEIRKMVEELGEVGERIYDRWKKKKNA